MEDESVQQYMYMYLAMCVMNLNWLYVYVFSLIYCKTLLLKLPTANYRDIIYVF